MKNTIRCCISCILPCGALDVVRIVHSNGRVEEISGTIRAGEVMKAHPKHVLKKPSTSPSEDGIVPKIVVVPPDAELQRGKIYFLMPLPPSSSAPEKKARQKSSSSKKRIRETGTNDIISTSSDHRRRGRHHQSNDSTVTATTASIAMANVNLLISDQYLSEILSEKLSTQRDRRRGRAAVWRPHLESISESPTDIGP
ncbi:hypothetical protein L484_003808 [Morus notabilis]|uniref:Uncharacterized protein n=1 Tax=Morus notabilis TaxID=981085 RepID=W9SE74_9ROSA|nr:uncharacterized protein LOC21387332 [Morus notabilis]EXC24831.1 hypothetical protein L484_003808 [Morus notabilis]